MLYVSHRRETVGFVKKMRESSSTAVMNFCQRLVRRGRDWGKYAYHLVWKQRFHCLRNTLKLVIKAFYFAEPFGQHPWPRNIT
jgi:hypothetical protein